MRCPSCDLYNAAVNAQQVAAFRIAQSRFPRVEESEAWLNEHGVFAYVDGIARQVGTEEEAAPFVALTGAARKVTVFWGGKP